MTSIDEDLWFDGGAGADAEDKAAQSMAAMAARIIGAKPLPLAARRLADLTRSPDARIGETVQVLESDPALSARLLRLVNSAGYALRMRCASVRHAAALVGTRRLHHVATTAAVMDLFDAGNVVAQRLLEHATVVGALCRYLAVHLGLPRDELFTAGFLHDIGQMMLLDAEGEAYVRVLSAAGAAADVAHLHEREHFGYDHAVLGAHVLGAWNIPEPIPKVVAWHHTPSRAYQNGGIIASMVAALRLADTLDHALLEEDSVAAIERVSKSDGAAYLDVSEAQLAAIWKELIELRNQCSARTGGGVVDAEIVPRHDIKPSASERAPASRMVQAPMHFPCIVCKKPSYGNVCPCCEGYVCPAHQSPVDEWCTVCTRGYHDAALESRITPVEYAGLSLIGLGLAAASAAGAASTTPDAPLNLVLAPGLTVLLGATVFIVARRWYVRARFVKHRRKEGFPVDAEPVLAAEPRYQAGSIPAARRNGVAAPEQFETRLDEILAEPEHSRRASSLLPAAMPTEQASPGELARELAGELAAPLPAREEAPLVSTPRPAPETTLDPALLPTTTFDLEISALAPPLSVPPAPPVAASIPPGSKTLRLAAVPEVPAPIIMEAEASRAEPAPLLSDYPRIDVRPLYSGQESVPPNGHVATETREPTAPTLRPEQPAAPVASSGALAAMPMLKVEAVPAAGPVAAPVFVENTRAVAASHRCDAGQWAPCVARPVPAMTAVSRPAPRPDPVPAEASVPPSAAREVVVSAAPPASLPPKVEESTPPAETPGRPSGVPSVAAMPSVVTTTVLQAATLPVSSIEPPAGSLRPGARSYGGALSISPTAFDDEPDPASRRGKGRRAGGSRRDRYR
ncbi:MAG TPA: HDOD domain-containing protein [Polyangiaceae bacterium]|nr:HDOD domain-containing protein [Polyangiaceae bacterium]